MITYTNQTSTSRCISPIHLRNLYPCNYNNYYIFYGFIIIWSSTLQISTNSHLTIYSLTCQHTRYRVMLLCSMSRVGLAVSAHKAIIRSFFLMMIKTYIETVSMNTLLLVAVIVICISYFGYLHLCFVLLVSFICNICECHFGILITSILLLFLFVSQFPSALYLVLKETHICDHLSCTEEALL